MKPKTLRLGQVALALLISLIAMEVLARVSFQLLTGQARNSSAMADARQERLDQIDRILYAGEQAEDAEGLYQFHPYLGYTGRPGARPWGESMPGYNALGILAPQGLDYPYRAKTEDYVIGVFGGSVAEAFANSPSALIGPLTRQRPELADRNIVVLPMAIAGYKQPQQLFLLQSSLLMGFDFDLVLNLDGFNELALADENLERGIHPLYPSGNHLGAMAQLGQQIPKPELVRLLSKRLRFVRAERRMLRFAQAPPLRRSAFVEALAHHASRASQAKVSATEGQIAVAAQMEDLPMSVRGPGADAFNPASGGLVGTWSQSSMMMHRICQQAGIDYVHVLQPNQYVRGSKPLTREEEEHAYDADSRWGKTAQTHYPDLIEAGRKLADEGVRFYDATMVFEQASAETLYIDNCCHLSERGNEILARAISEYLGSTARGDSNGSGYEAWVGDGD